MPARQNGEKAAGRARDMMADINSGLGWSAAQWETVNNTVSEAFAKASVAGAFLPCYGPLSGSAENVREVTFDPAAATLRVRDDTTVRFFNLTVDVELSSEQVADDGLSSALWAFRRAANNLAQVEDDIVFNGYGPARQAVRIILPAVPDLVLGVVQTPSHPDTRGGLVNDHTANQIDRSARDLARARAAATKPAKRGARAPAAPPTAGDHVVKEVAAAVVDLERNAHPGPFACVLGAAAFVAVHTPAEGLVLPADRITPILNGPLLRSGRMGEDQGIVVSLAGNDIDIVVATPPKTQFLQMTSEARYFFRVYEKFVLRIKDQTAVHGLSI
jgi:uncharacterized linocin/CFP29 family protein